MEPCLLAMEITGHISCSILPWVNILRRFFRAGICQITLQLWWNHSLKFFVLCIGSRTHWCPMPMIVAHFTSVMKDVFRAFPSKPVLGLCPIFMATLARKDENWLQCILDWNKLDKVTMNSIKKIKHISGNSSFLRAIIINWLVQDEVSLCYLDEKIHLPKKKNKARNSLDETNNPLNRASSSNKFPT